MIADNWLQKLEDRIDKDIQIERVRNILNNALLKKYITENMLKIFYDICEYTDIKYVASINNISIQRIQKIKLDFKEKMIEYLSKYNNNAKELL